MANFMSRLFKHRLLDERDAERALGAGGGAHIAARVAASEARHTGQIRVCIEAGLPLNYLRRGAKPRATTASSSTCCSPSMPSRSSPIAASTAASTPPPGTPSRRR
jgi:hypothetical protein